MIRRRVEKALLQVGGARKNNRGAVAAVREIPDFTTIHCLLAERQ